MRVHRRGRRQPAPAQPPEWELVPEGWGRETRGWDVETIADVYRTRWPEFLRAVDGAGPLGVAHEVMEGVPIPREDHGWHNIVVSYGYVLARAAYGLERLSVLDWGGGPGHYYVLGRALLPEVELDYHSRDLPRLVALGRELLPEATFHDDDSCLDRRYDLVLAGTSLHYAPEPWELLDRLTEATGRFLYVAGTPVVRAAEPYVVLQRPHGYGYETEYLGWVLNRGELLERASATGLVLDRELLAAGRIEVEGAPEPGEHRSFLFRRS